VGAFLKSADFIKHPDIQFHFFPCFFDKNWIPQPTTYGYRLGVGPMRPSSRGNVRLQSANVQDPLLIDPNYMSSEQDWKVMRQAMRLGHKLLTQKAFEKFHYRQDTPAIDMCDDKTLDAFIRKDSSSAYHPCGTCKIGSEGDPNTVVNPELKVVGLNKLRIVDASVMPSLPSANINAATVMIAEKASDMILKTKTEKSKILPFA
jgi:choline dehydrogenase